MARREKEAEEVEAERAESQVGDVKVDSISATAGAGRAAEARAAAGEEEVLEEDFEGGRGGVEAFLEGDLRGDGAAFFEGEASSAEESLLRFWAPSLGLKKLVIMAANVFFWRGGGRRRYDGASERGYFEFVR